MRILKKLAKIFVRLALLTIAGIALLLAFFRVEVRSEVTLPKPTGPYPIGRVEYNWVDSNRIDSLAPSPGIKRELPIWIWYPADSGNGRDRSAAEYLPKQWQTAGEQLRAKSNKSLVGAIMSTLMNDFLSRDDSRIHSYAIQNANLSPDQARYPVVLFKPGGGDLTIHYTTLCEDLASHGYIVVASDSPYLTGFVVFNDGRVVARKSGIDFDDMSTALADKLIPVLSADLHFELDQLEQIDKNDPSNMFNGRLNLDEVGAFGHSFGGAAAAQFCHDDPRCRAGIDLDGIPSAMWLKV